jgi:hypothetical protein
MAGPLDRTWYNTLVDDDGSNTVGSLWDKADVDSLMDAVDAQLALVPTVPVSVANGGTGATTLTDDGVLYGNGTGAIGATAVGTAGQVLTSNGAGNAPSFQAAASGGASWVEQSTAVTGAQHNFDLDDHLTVLRCTGAAPVFSGFTVNGGAPAAGDQVLIVCLGTTAKVTNQDAGSTAAHRIITPSTNGQIVGLNGLMLLVYDDTTDRWREVLLDAGAAITVAHSAGDYTGSGSLTWTVEAGDLQVYTYRQLGTSLEISITIGTSTTGGTTHTGLRAALPAGFTGATGNRFAICYAFNNGANLVAYMQAAGTTYMAFIRLDAANWTLETNATYIGFTGLVPIQ